MGLVGVLVVQEKAVCVARDGIISDCCMLFQRKPWSQHMPDRLLGPAPPTHLPSPRYVPGRPHLATRQSSSEC